MKIGIVAPSSVPFERGGAENLYEALHAYINEETPHDCDLIKIPSREHSFFDLLRTYRDFMDLKLDHFDLVIATKYPSWMVEHENLAIYMVHPLRGLYDTYHFLQMPDEPEGLPNEVDNIYQNMKAFIRDDNFSGDAARSVIESFLAFENSDLQNNPCFAFPAPLIRKIIHFLDKVGMSSKKVKQYAAISDTVKNRKDYFPEGASVDTLYPPPFETNFYNDEPQHIFTVSRLDGPKRISLLVEAMRKAETDVPLYIAGSGPDEATIKEAAGDDPRIKFLGRVSNEKILEYYSKSIFVPFIPYEEDYGYVTIEAMKSGKPVLTTTDSGGPGEFVKNGMTGLIVPPEASSLANAIDDLCGDVTLAKSMGQRAKETVQDISWQTVVEGLTGEKLVKKQQVQTSNALATSKSSKKKMILGSTFPIFPARGGGQTRIYNIYSRLAEHYDVEVISLAFPDHDGVSRREIAPNLFETVIPLTPEHRHEEIELMRTVDFIPLTDVAYGMLWHLTPSLKEAFQEYGKGADICVASHPFTSTALKQALPNVPLWSESHNVEYAIKKEIFQGKSGTERILREVHEVEKFSWMESERFYACTEEDLKALEEMYGPNSVPKHVVPNGVDLRNVPYVSAESKKQLKARLGVGDEKIAVFLASYHQPNIESAELIIKWAKVLPDVRFHIVGSVCSYFSGKVVPENVVMFSTVTDEQKNWLLASADLALNPMFSGSGSNLKMFDYMAIGTPILSTEFGVRGMDGQGQAVVSLAKEDNFADMIGTLLNDSGSLSKQSLNAREYVADNFDWDVIVGKFLKELGDN